MVMRIITVLFSENKQEQVFAGLHCRRLGEVHAGPLLIFANYLSPLLSAQKISGYTDDTPSAKIFAHIDTSIPYVLPNTNTKKNI
jgi:hypothetical protein